MADISSGFLLNQAGKVAIVFDDPAFVLAETILLDRKSGALHAILYEQNHHIGDISKHMIEAFAVNHNVLLTSRRGDGSIIDLQAGLVVYN
jgi:hypothetical protein